MLSGISLDVRGVAAALARVESDLNTGRFPAGDLLEIRCCETATFVAMYVDHERDFHAEGDWLSKCFHRFDLSLSPRPTGAQGCFPDVFQERQKLGKILFLPAGYRFHGEGNPGRQQNLCVFLRANHAFGDQEEFGEHLSAVLQHCINLRSDTIKGILLRIGQELQTPGFASGLLLDGLGTTLLAETIRLLHELRRTITRKGGLSPWRMAAIEERVLGGETVPTLNELADICRLSRRHLFRAFREESGKNLGEFVRHMTIERAKTKLRMSEQPIATISASLGFQNAAAFSTAFRRVTGESPRDYRAACPRSSEGQGATR
jgi:AraC family transcriptional regulator